MKLTSARKLALMRGALFMFLGGHLAWLGVNFWTAVTAFSGALGANPVEFAIRWLGIHALRLLVVTLAITPLVRLTGWSLLTGLRRQLGLWTFAFAALHVLLYLAADLELSLAALGEDILKRRYITAGMAAFVLLAPLAATSTARAMRALGARRWQRLHRLIYPAALLACLHFIFMVKGFQIEPLIYAGIAVLLLALRLPWLRRTSPA